MEEMHRAGKQGRGDTAELLNPLQVHHLPTRGLVHQTGSLLNLTVQEFLWSSSSGPLTPCRRLVGRVESSNPLSPDPLGGQPQPEAILGP